MLTPKEKAHIIALCEVDPIVKTLYEAYLAPDPTRYFHNEQSLMITHLSDELKYLRTGQIEKLTILNSEEKLFERINLVLVNGPKYLDTLAKGLEQIDPESAVKDLDDGKKKKIPPLKFKMGGSRE